MVVLLHFVILESVFVLVCGALVAACLLYSCATLICKWRFKSLEAIARLSTCTKCLLISFNKKRKLITKIFPMIHMSGADDEEQVAMLHGYIVPDIFIEQLFLYCSIMIILSTTMFISAYISNKSLSQLCILESDAFCFEQGKIFREQLDCKNSSELGNVTSIVCYQLTLNVSEAIEAVVATLAGGAFYFSFVTWLLLKIAQLNCWQRKRKCTKKAAIILLQLFIMATAMVLVLGWLMSLIVQGGAAVAEYAEVCVYMIAVLLGGIMPWWRFIQPMTRSSHSLRIATTAL